MPQKRVLIRDKGALMVTELHLVEEINKVGDRTQPSKEPTA